MDTENVIPPGWVLPAGGSRLIPATPSVTFFDDGSGPIVGSEHSCQWYSEPDSPGMADLRRLAVTRDDRLCHLEVRLSCLPPALVNAVLNGGLSASQGRS